VYQVGIPEFDAVPPAPRQRLKKLVEARHEDMRDPSLILDDPEALLVYWRERTMMRTGVMGRTGHPRF
jgi:hypothetical protein